MQHVVVTDHPHLCHTISPSRGPVGAHDEVDPFERCPVFPVDGLYADFTVRRRDRADAHSQRPRGMRDPAVRAGGLHHPLVQADVRWRYSLDLREIECAGARPDCVAKPA